MGGDAIFERLKDHLDIGNDETTDDGKVTLEHLECNAACDYAPVMMVNWEFMDNMTPASATQLVDDLRTGVEVRSTRGPRICTPREAERVLAGFPDDRADEGPSAGPASLVGVELARANGWTAPSTEPERRHDGHHAASGPTAPVVRRRQGHDLEQHDRCGRAGRHLACGVRVQGRRVRGRHQGRPERRPERRHRQRLQRWQQRRHQGRLQGGEVTDMLTPVLTCPLGHGPGWTLASYESVGGYQALEKALAMEPAAVIEEVKDSGPRGRGGAGFPTGMKWGFIPQDNPNPKYLVVNADEWSRAPARTSR